MQPVVQLYQGHLTVSWPGLAADHLPLPSAKVKDECNCTSTSVCAVMMWCLIKHRDSVKDYEDCCLQGCDSVWAGRCCW
jgi:hypothetical protein